MSRSPCLPPPCAQVLHCYSPDAPISARLGTAQALHACAPELGDAQVPLALDFLIRNGLADDDDKVRVDNKSGWGRQQSAITRVGWGGAPGMGLSDVPRPG